MTSRTRCLDISEYALTVDPAAGNGTVVAEVFASTEKSGSGTDGWMVEAAESFNASGARLSDGSDAKVAIRQDRFGDRLPVRRRR